jgi:iron complex transport system substrate-binding protein
MNNSILLSSSPKRIVSLVPSITELLVDLGLEKNIVGITKFCIEPSYLKTQCKIIGGTKKINIDLIKSLNPDIIIANKEENIENDVLEMMNFSNVWISDIKTLNDNLHLISELGKIFNRINEANEIIIETKKCFNNLNNIKLKDKEVLYLIWKKPYMSVGKDTFIHDILSQIGLKNCINEFRYPIIDLKNFEKVDYVFLSSEPYPFSTKEMNDFQNIFPYSKIVLVDGSYFSWYGSRISKSKEYFEKLISNLV